MSHDLKRKERNLFPNFFKIIIFKIEDEKSNLDSFCDKKALS